MRRKKGTSPEELHKSDKLAVAIFDLIRGKKLEPKLIYRALRKAEKLHKDLTKIG